MKVRRRDEQGAAALEFGIIFPVIILAILGIIQYGYQFWSYTTASAVAREAARRSVVGYDWDCTVAEAVNKANKPALGATPTVTRVFKANDGTVSATPAYGGIVEVTVTFHSLNMHLPFLPIPGGGEINQTAVARVENVPPSPIPCDQ